MGTLSRGSSSTFISLACLISIIFCVCRRSEEVLEQIQNRREEEVVSIAEAEAVREAAALAFACTKAAYCN